MSGTECPGREELTRFAIGNMEGPDLARVATATAREMHVRHGDDGVHVLAYLRSHGFKTYIVSGGGVEFMRGFAERSYGIPPEQVIGSSGATRFAVRPDGVPVLTREPKVFFVDDGPGKPESIDDFWMGHPYRRWSTFLKSSVIDELKRSKAKVYLAHGTADEADSVIGFDVMRAELLAAGRDVTAERVEGGDHGLGVKGQSGMQKVFGNVLEWFLK